MYGCPKNLLYIFLFNIIFPDTPSVTKGCKYDIVVQSRLEGLSRELEGHWPLPRTRPDIDSFMESLGLEGLGERAAAKGPFKTAEVALSGSTTVKEYRALISTAVAKTMKAITQGNSMLREPHVGFLAKMIGRSIQVVQKTDKPSQGSIQNAPDRFEPVLLAEPEQSGSQDRPPLTIFLNSVRGYRGNHFQGVKLSDGSIVDAGGRGNNCLILAVKKSLELESGNSDLERAFRNRTEKKIRQDMAKLIEPRHYQARVDLLVDQLKQRT